MNSCRKIVKTSLFLIFVSLTSIAQEKYFINKGKINFASYAELEIIKASSDKVQGVVDPVSSQLAFSVDMTTFEGFRSALQKEHFMENYIETDQYPKSTFKGKIIEQIDFSKDSTYEVRVKGDLEIHGTKQNRIIKGIITISKGMMSIECNFIVPLSDHNIHIPKIVNQKIATEIKVDFTATMIPKK